MIALLQPLFNHFPVYGWDIPHKGLARLKISYFSDF